MIRAKGKTGALRRVFRYETDKEGRSIRPAATRPANATEPQMTARTLLVTLLMLVMTGLFATGCGRRSDLDTPSMAAQAEKRQDGQADEPATFEATQDSAGTSTDAADSPKSTVKERPFLLDKLIQ